MSKDGRICNGIQECFSKLMIFNGENTISQEIDKKIISINNIHKKFVIYDGLYYTYPKLYHESIDKIKSRNNNLQNGNSSILLNSLKLKKKLGQKLNFKKESGKFFLTETINSSCDVNINTTSTCHKKTFSSIQLNNKFNKISSNQVKPIKVKTNENEKLKNIFKSLFSVKLKIKKFDKLKILDKDLKNNFTKSKDSNDKIFKKITVIGKKIKSEKTLTRTRPENYNLPKILEADSKLRQKRINLSNFRFLDNSRKINETLSSSRLDSVCKTKSDLSSTFFMTSTENKFNKKNILITKKILLNRFFP